MLARLCSSLFFFLNEPPPTEISPLSLPAALPISPCPRRRAPDGSRERRARLRATAGGVRRAGGRAARAARREARQPLRRRLRGAGRPRGGGEIGRAHA